MGQSTEELTTEIAGTRQRMASDLDALQDRVSPAAIIDRRKEAARSKVSSLRSKVMGSASNARSSAASSGSGAASSVQGSVQGVAQGVADGAHGAVSTAQDRVEGSPLAAGLVAFGAGVVIAGLIPATAKEAQAASFVADTAQEKGGPLLDQAKSLGQEMGQDLKESAMGAAQQVKDSAAESAAKVKDEGQSAADTVKTQAQPGS